MKVLASAVLVGHLRRLYTVVNPKIVKPLTKQWEHRWLKTQGLVDVNSMFFISKLSYPN